MINLLGLSGNIDKREFKIIFKNVYKLEFNINSLYKLLNSSKATLLMHVSLPNILNKVKNSSYLIHRMFISILL